MDRALKERIVGAIVLVVFIVLVVPVFLDGPADDREVLTESVTLPGQNGQERKRQTIVLERDRSEPVPAATAPTTAGPRPAASQLPKAETGSGPGTTTASEPLAQEPPDEASAPTSAGSSATSSSAAEEPPPREPERAAAAPSAAPAVTSATGMWAVQLGSFGNKANAERLAAELRGKGYAAFLSQLQNGGRQMHRVRIGPQKDRESAESTAARLSRDGHKGQVVPHP